MRTPQQHHVQYIIVMVMIMIVMKIMIMIMKLKLKLKLIMIIMTIIYSLSNDDNIFAFQVMMS